MADEIDVEATAGELRRAVSQVKRRMRSTRSSELSAPESSVLSRLDRNGSDNIAGLARWDQVTPQTMGSTVAALEARGFIQRQPDPDDGRRFPDPRSEARAAADELRDAPAFVRTLHRNRGSLCARSRERQHA